jgi:hypothetical protein
MTFLTRPTSDELLIFFASFEAIDCHLPVLPDRVPSQAALLKDFSQTIEGKLGAEAQ